MQLSLSFNMGRRSKKKKNKYKNSTQYYFAYGSNLSIGQLIARVGRVTRIRKKYLYGWKLRYNVTSSGFANIEFTGNPEDVVEGIIYALNGKQINVLDRYEASYNRVILFDNVQTYLAKPGKLIAEDKLNKPYRTLILHSKKEHGFN
jgi:hypothetical protein